MSKIITIYESILRYAGLESDEKGYVSARIVDDKNPVMVDGKRLVLPTDNQLKMFNPDEKMVFHPLSENILRGESLVLIKLKTAVNIKLNYAIGILAKSLLDIAASPALHGKLNEDQSDLLMAIREADEKSVVNFTTLMIQGVKNRSDKLYTNIYLKRGGTVKDKRYHRVGIVNFPFYDDLINDRIEKIRVKDKETFKQVFEFIFPDIATAEAYNYGTETQVAPFLDALMGSSIKLASKINDIVMMYKDYIDDYERLLFDSEWFEYFNDLDSLSIDIRRIPIQHGNDGSISVIEQKEEAAPQVQQQYQPQPQYQSQPPQQQPYIQQAPQQQYQPQPQYQQQYQPQQPPPVDNSKTTLDWKSVAASNPALGGPPPMIGGAMQMPMQQPMMYNTGFQQPMQNMNVMQGPPIVNTPNGPMVVINNQYVPLQHYQQMMMQQQNPMNVAYQNGPQARFGY